MSRNEIIKKIEALISRGGIVKIHKVKALPMGKCWVSVGPYANAVPDKLGRFAVISTGRTQGAKFDVRHRSAFEAAQDFVRFVGNDKAKEALRHA